VLDEQGIERDPVLRVDGAGEFALRLLGGTRPHDAEAVRDPVDVGVDRDRRDPVSEHEHAVRRLGTDAVEGRQLVERTGDDPVKPAEEVARHRPDHPGLRVVESGPADERLDRPRRSGGEGGRVRVPREQEGARRVGRLVPGALGEDRTDEDLERVLGMVPEIRGSPISRSVERREPVEERLPVELRVGHEEARRPAGRRAATVAGGGPTPGDP
jgi:hypothetical protein